MGIVHKGLYKKKLDRKKYKADSVQYKTKYRTSDSNKSRVCILQSV